MATPKNSPRDAMVPGALPPSPVSVGAAVAAEMASSPRYHTVHADRSPTVAARRYVVKVVAEKSDIVTNRLL